ncbi:MAG: hypothetical protein ACK44E_07165 [Anaerolineales bacterium]
MAGQAALLDDLLRQMPRFCQVAGGRTLRSYQRVVAEAVLDSVFARAGRSIVVVFPRQSGKNELQAQLEAYLLLLFSPFAVEMVKVSPTWKPQTLNAMRRLERVLDRNLLTRRRYVRESGHIVRLGKARLIFLSGAPTANVMGVTANLLLECDEAQDIQIEKWDREFAPMAASTNATRLFCGTAWTADTLLARELRAARQAEAQDGIRRAFVLTADAVAQEVPLYGQYVAEQIARLGRFHPLVRTQYFSEEIDAQSTFFTPERLQLMRGEHPAETQPDRQADYAFCLDVGGTDRSLLANTDLSLLDADQAKKSHHDSSALTVLRIDLSTLSDPLIAAPTYRVVNRCVWSGVRQADLYAQLLALAEAWSPRYFVVDASGLGSALAEFLARRLGRVVVPFVFTAQSKSQLGWDFLALVESGRYKEYCTEDETLRRWQDWFFRQAQGCQMEILPGPERRLQWGVPEGRRDPVTQEPLHDDLLISAALCALLDRSVVGDARSSVIQAFDPLAGYREVV